MAGYEEVYRQHLNAVFRYAQRVVGRRDVAEEITSDAFIALWKVFDTIDTSQLPGWLFTVVRNRATDFWRRSSVEQKYLAGLETQPVTPGRSQHAFVDWLNAAPSLKPIHRAVLILRYVHGSERTEIAARLGLSETQVKGHLQYAHTLLRKELSEAE
jgi:RNA polymerase sigma-70 factor (ECF subfamily)